MSMRTRKLKKGKELTVFKGNRLINEARYKLTLNEQKFILFAISKIKKDDKNKDYIFHIKEFIDLLNLEPHNAYGTLRRIIISIMRKPFTWSSGPDTEIFFHWFSPAKYKRRQATVSFKFSDELIPYLFDLKKQFTVYRLQNILRLNSVYSIRIYELLKQSEWIGGREINLNELKELLGIPTIYPMYNDFKRNVLEIARKELSSRSDISFNYREIKKRKRVVALFLKGAAKRKIK